MRRREPPLGAFEDPQPGHDASPQPKAGAAAAGAPAAPAAIPVSELNRRAQSRLETDAGLRDVWVEGEVREARLWSSGHFYFTLADAEAQVRCVMWSSAVDRQDALPNVGDLVLARGTVGIYQRKGEFQLAVRDLRPAGLGLAAQALEALRRRLQAEGLFAEERKRALPRHPRAVGVVTSMKGAVLHDVLDVTGRRHPAVPVLVAGVRVQGATAPAEIAAAVRRLGESGRVDVVVVARGGGGAEDLSPFNDEAVVRAVAGCAVPVVSAVGHETDVTLTDFAADVRAPTPSAAAELVVPLRDELLRRVDEAEERLRLALAHVAEQAGARLDAARARADAAARIALERARARLGAAAAGLDAVSPLATLARGYAVVRKKGKVVGRGADLAPGDVVHIRFQDGEKDAEIQ